MENESKNGRFLNNLVKYGGWIIAVAAFGWTASNFVSNKVDANVLNTLTEKVNGQIKQVDDKVNSAININDVQKNQIDTINKNLKDINDKLDKILGWYK